MSAKPICIALPDELLAALDRHRARDERSRSNLIARYVRRGLLGDGATVPPVTAKEADDAR